MELQRTRLFLFILLMVVGFSLYTAWQQEHHVPITTKGDEPSLPTQSEVVPKATDIPSVAVDSSIPSPHVIPSLSTSAQLIDITTDVLKVKIDPIGGDIVYAELIQYPLTIQNPDKGVVLLDRSSERNYIAQSGLIGKDDLGPDSRVAGRAHYTTAQTNYQMNANNELQVDLTWHNEKGLQITKSFLFKRSNYLVDISYHIKNSSSAPWIGSFYAQLKREFTKQKSNGMFSVQMYQGGAFYTPQKPYTKISFSDMKKENLNEQIQGGWAAMLEHYFLSAWIPNADVKSKYYTRVDNEDVYNIGAVTPVEVAPLSEKVFTGRLYIGPEITDTLKNISPGLNLTVDYGILWPISQLLFWVLKEIYEYVHNWGWSIILVTLLIKIAFYGLSASSYRSMGRMRQLQPRIELLRERYKDDKQQFSVSLMALYKEEKMNPLGGCLPILIQIPVFIALYYVLLESVELRHAPFMFWIKDLSSADPYYVLPIIMGLTMLLQQKMNPPPPDPVQAKVMMLMPVIFTALFLSFPSGLVLYWTVNNVLSIAQQWFITRNMGSEKAVAKKAK